MTPIDLAALAAGKYRISVDPSAEIDRDHESRAWFLRIPGSRGFISPHGPGHLAVYTDCRRLFDRLKAIPTARVAQEGDQELRVVIAPNFLDQAAELIKARRKRQISDSQRQRLAELSREHSPFRAKAPSVARSSASATASAAPRTI
jgi:hypothetical protein